MALPETQGDRLRWAMKEARVRNQAIADAEGVRPRLPPEIATAARRPIDASEREMAIGVATSGELHCIGTGLMAPNFPPTLAAGHVLPGRLLESLAGLQESIRALLRDAGRQSVSPLPTSARLREILETKAQVHSELASPPTSCAAHAIMRRASIRFSRAPVATSAALPQQPSHRGQAELLHRG